MFDINKNKKTCIKNTQKGNSNRIISIVWKRTTAQHNTINCQLYWPMLITNIGIINRRKKYVCDLHLLQTLSFWNLSMLNSFFIADQEVDFYRLSKKKKNIPKWKHSHSHSLNILNIVCLYVRVLCEATTTTITTNYM